MKIEGGEKLRRQLLKAQKQLAREMATFLPAEAQDLMSQANAQVPRLTGELAASATVTSDVKGLRVRAVAAYKDDKAAAVHEGIHGRRKIQGTKGFKWFERALQTWESGFYGRIAARLKSLIGAR